MSVRQRATLLMAVCWRLASLPPTLAHELTHMLLSVPWADETAIAWHEHGVSNFVAWSEDAPQWAVVLASLGPTFLGALVGIGGLWQIVAAPPSSGTDMLITGALAAWWVIYAAPSPDDMDIYQTNG